MFLERVAVFTLQVREKIRSFLNSLLQETGSQLVQILITCFLVILTALLYYVWITPAPLWVKISYSFIYVLCVLFSATVIHFHMSGRRIRKISNGMEVYSLNEEGLKNSQYRNIKVIELTEVQAEKLFREFSKQYLNGSYQSFRALTALKSIPPNKRLIWIDTSPKRPKEVNRQSLLEFLNQLFIDFKMLENQQMMELTRHYFVLKNPAGKEQHSSTKNISDWRTNEAPYLQDISRLFQSCL